MALGGEQITFFFEKKFLVSMIRNATDYIFNIYNILGIHSRHYSACRGSVAALFVLSSVGGCVDTVVQNLHFFLQREVFCLFLFWRLFPLFFDKLLE